MIVPPFRRDFDTARDPRAALAALGYAAGTWTPTLTFATPGDVSVSYTTREGNYTRMARRVVADFYILTSAFTHTTASGNLQLTGLPFTCRSGHTAFMGPCAAAGWTKANYTQIAAQVAASTAIVIFAASGSGQALSTLASGDMPTGGTVALRGFCEYEV